MAEVQASESGVVADPAKRFYLFEYDGYYPIGAVEDHTGMFATLEAAEAAIQRRNGYQRYDSADILDSWTGTWY